MAGRILGMGDVVSLVERASEQFEADEAKKLEEKLRKSTFDFEDFTSQLNKIRKMGGFMSLMKMIPGMGGALPDNLSVDDGEFNRIEGIINSMTKQERQNPEILGIARRQRIAKGSGVSLTEVNQLIKQFMQMRQMMSRLGRGGGGMGAAMGDLMSGGMGTGGGGGGAYGMGRHGSATKASKKPRKKREKPKRNKKKRR
jgi:signal recognition particle subunit SRP54